MLPEKDKIPVGEVPQKGNENTVQPSAADGTSPPAPSAPPSPAVGEKPAQGESPVVFAGKESAPPLSQREREHLTYLRVLGEYNIAKERRRRYKRYGALFIIISGIIFLTLIFSLEAKILFLCLWILTILACVAVMLRADFKYDTYKEYLGLADELDFMEKEEEEEEE